MTSSFPKRAPEQGILAGADAYAATAILLFALGVVTRLTGFGRELLMAFYLGANQDTDALVYSLMFYDMAVTLGSAVLIAAIPLFSAKLAAGQPIRPLYRRCSLMFLGIMLPLAVLLQQFAPFIARFTGAHTTGNSALLGRYLALMAWSFVLVGYASVQVAVLQTKRRFVAPALTGAVVNIAAVCALVLFRERLGAMSIAVGLLVGLGLQIVIQEIGIRRITDSEPGDGSETAEMRTFATRLAGIATGLLILRCMYIVERWLALATGPNALSYIGYASRLTQFPLALVGLAGSTALLPYQSNLKHAGHSQQYRELTDKALRASLLIGLISTAVLAALAHPIVAFGYQHGRFSASDAAATAGAVIAYSGMLAPTFVNLIFQNVMFTFARKREYIVISLVSLVVYTFIAKFLAASLGFTGIGWAGTLLCWLYAFGVGLYLHRAGYIRFASNTWSFLGRCVAAATAAYFVMYGCSIVLPKRAAEGIAASLLLQLVLPSAAGLVIFYVIGARLLGVGELKSLRKRIEHTIANALRRSPEPLAANTRA